MNNLRKIAAGSLAAVLAFSMAACGSSNASDGTGESTGKAVTVNEKSAKATSLADFGTMEDLEKAAKEEGALNVIALPHDWSNYGEVIEGFKKKYPEIKVTELNPNASSKEELDAAKTNKGTDAAPDVFDVGQAIAATSTDYFAPYKVQAWDKIPDAVKNADGAYYADYTGIMSVGWNADKYGDVTSLNDLLDPKFAGTVSLNGKPTEAGAAFNGYLMVNQLAGGDINNLQPGLDFFKKLKEAGNLNTIDVTNGTIDSGQTGVVFDWTYNQASYKKELKSKGVNWKYKTFPKAQVVSYYNQAINKDAPHPAAARLWEEYLYTAETQNLWFKGGANPVLLDSMKADGTVDQATLKDAITSKASRSPTATMTPPASPSGFRTTGTRRSATEAQTDDRRNRIHCTERTRRLQGRGSVRRIVPRFVRAGEASSGAWHARHHAPVLRLHRLLPARTHRHRDCRRVPGSQRRFHACELQ